MTERRQERVAHLVQAELARVLLREAKDPRLREVTITGIRMTADLRLARVWVRTLGDPSGRQSVLDALARATPFLRAEIGHTLGMRVVPELRFEYDTTSDTARRLDALLSGRRPPDGEDESA